MVYMSVPDYTSAKWAEMAGVDVAVVGDSLAMIAHGHPNTIPATMDMMVMHAQAIRREAPAVGSVSYLIRQLGQVQFGNQNWTTNIQGVSYNYPPVTNWQIASGRGISVNDEAQAALVPVQP